MTGDVDAEAIAQELVAKKTPLLREEIMQLAFYLPDQGQHKAAGERGSAFFAGAYRHGGITRLRSSCRSRPWSIQAITKYIRYKVPETVFTSFAILYDQEAKPHRDSGNDATPNVVIKLSDFKGGGLWIEDPLGQDARDIDGPRDRDVGRDRIKDRIIKTSLDLHKSDRSPDHRVCASASPTTATSIRSNTSDERYSQALRLLWEYPKG